MANDNAPDSSRSRIALGVAASAVTLAIATTLAALLGYLGPGGPAVEEPAAAAVPVPSAPAPASAQPPAAEPVVEVAFDDDDHDDHEDHDDHHEDDDDQDSDGD